MESNAPKYQGEWESDVSHLRKCALCEKLVPRVEEAFLGHLSEEHNINSMSEYNAYCETVIALNSKQHQTSLKQEEILAEKRNGPTESEKVDSGMEDGDSDHELASLLAKQPGLVDQSDTSRSVSLDASTDVDVYKRSKETILTTPNHGKFEVKLEKKDEG